MKIGVVGAGNMGTAIIKGFTKQKENHAFSLIVKAFFNEAIEKLSKDLEFKLTTTASAFVNQFPDIVILTTPSPVTLSAITELKENGLSSNAIIMSAAAGITVSQLKAILPDNDVVTFIPNIPVSINKGTISVYFNDISESATRITKEVLGTLGDVVEVNPNQLAIAGTISGCGPAFVDVFMDAMEDAAVAEGLNRTTASILISSMVKGAGELAFKSNKSVADLKGQVTSPGGTTIRGVLELESGSFRNTIIKAVQAAN